MAINAIAPHPLNLREDDLWESEEDRAETVASIKSTGLVQALVVCTREAFAKTYPAHLDSIGTAEFVVMAGHRRLDACREAGMQKVRIDVQDDKLQHLDLLMLVENLKRKSLTVFQEAEGYRRLEARGESHSQIAAQVGRSKSTVTKRLRLLELPPEARAAVQRGELSADNAYALLVALEDQPERVVEAAELMRQEGLPPQDAVNLLLAGSERTGQQEPDETQARGEAEPASDGKPVRSEPDGEKSVRSEPVEPSVPPARGKPTASTAGRGDKKSATGRAAAGAARHAYCERLVAEYAKPVPEPQGVRVAFQALHHASPWAVDRAHRWLVAAGAENAEALSPQGYRDSVLVGGDPAAIVRLAYAVALAEAELRAGSRSRSWDYRDTAHLQHLIACGYEPAEWEQQQLGASASRA